MGKEQKTGDREQKEKTLPPRQPTSKSWDYKRTGTFAMYFCRSKMDPTGPVRTVLRSTGGGVEAAGWWASVRRRTAADTPTLKNTITSVCP